MTTIYPAPGDKPLIAPVSIPEFRHLTTVTCWCGHRQIVDGSPEQVAALADRHYRTHRWVNRWPGLLGPTAWSLTSHNRSF